MHMFEFGESLYRDSMKLGYFVTDGLNNEADDENNTNDNTNNKLSSIHTIYWLHRHWPEQLTV